MAKKNQNDIEHPLIELIQKLWAPFIGFVGAVTLVTQFLQLWSGDTATVTYVSAVLGILVVIISLSWVSFSQKKSKGKKVLRYPNFAKWSRLGLVICGIVILIAGYALYRQRNILLSKVVVLIAQLDGPESQYGITNELIEKLSYAISEFDDAALIPIDEVITTTEGSEYALNVGKRYGADIVIWGWYKPTQNPNLTIHIETVEKQQFEKLNLQEVYKPTTSLTELESFTLQQNIGDEISGLVIFISGYVKYEAGDLEDAYFRFSKVINEYPSTNNLYNETVLYNARGMTAAIMQGCDVALSDFEYILNKYPENEDALFNHGWCLLSLAKPTEALIDFDKLISLNPAFDKYYYGRANAYLDLEEYETAIDDFTEAISIDPSFGFYYNNRGHTYYLTGKYEDALSDFNTAISLEEGSIFNIANYEERANVYFALGDTESALNDFYYAIQIDPHEANVSDYYIIAVENNLKGNYIETLRVLELGIEIHPDNGELYCQNGYANEMLYNLDQAISNYKECLQLTTDIETHNLFSERLAHLLK